MLNPIDRKIDCFRRVYKDLQVFDIKKERLLS